MEKTLRQLVKAKNITNVEYDKGIYNIEFTASHRQVTLNFTEEELPVDIREYLYR